MRGGSALGGGGDAATLRGHSGGRPRDGRTWWVREAARLTPGFPAGASRQVAVPWAKGSNTGTFGRV